MVWEETQVGNRKRRLGLNPRAVLQFDMPTSPRSSRKIKEVSELPHPRDICILIAVKLVNYSRMCPVDRKVPQVGWEPGGFVKPKV